VGAWLYNEGTGNVRDLCVGNATLTKQSGGVWESRGLKNTTGAIATQNTAPPPRLKLTGQVSMFWRGILLGAPDQFRPKLCGMLTDSGDSTRLLPAHGPASGGGEGEICAKASAPRGDVTAGITGLAANRVYTVRTYQPSGVAKLYVNGVSRATSAALASAITYGATPTFYAPGSGVSTRGVNAVTFEVYVWKRILNADEFKRLTVEPYALYAQKAPRTLYFFIGCGGSSGGKNAEAKFTEYRERGISNVTAVYHYGRCVRAYDDRQNCLQRDCRNRSLISDHRVWRFRRSGHGALFGGII
jgi:hypothetical protein